MDRAQLLRWDTGGTPQECAAQVIADPHFAHAVRALAGNMMAATAADKKLDGIFKDAGRYVAAMLAVHLHTTGGLTLPRLKAMCKAFGYLSPGRARAMLIYLQYLGYVELIGSGAPARYAPTPRFISAWRSHLWAALDAARLIEPAVDVVLERLKEAETFAIFARLHTEYLLGLADDGGQDAPFIRVFVHRYAGSQIVWSLLLADTSDFPPSKPVRFSVAAAARRFAVSRMHIQRIVEEAEREGLLVIGDGGTITLTEATRDFIRTFYAMQLLGLVIAAARTLGAWSERIAVSGPAHRVAAQGVGAAPP